MLRWRAGGIRGGARMCQLRREQHAAVAARLHRPLPMQRVWTVPQDKRREPAAGETEQTAGECPTLV